MAVGSSNLTGIPNQRPAQVQKVQPKEGQTTTNQSVQGQRASALKGANTPTLPTQAVQPQGTVVTTAAPRAPVTTGGTTTPSGVRGLATGAIAGQARPGALAAALAMATSPNLLAALGGAAVASTRKRVSSISGDEKEDMGDVEIETESEAQPDALQEADQEQGAGEITEAGSTSGPAT